jgi:hypothetical protein
MSVPPPLDGDAVKLGLVMETAERQQRTVESLLQRLHELALDLEPALRDQIHRATIEAFHGLSDEATRAAQVLRDLRRTTPLRIATVGTILAVIATAIPVGIGLWYLPSVEKVDALRREQARLAENIESLRRDGAGIEWSRCGDARRICLRIDRKAPLFGGQADFAIPKGY